MKRLGDLGEFGWIQRLKRLTAGAAAVRRGIGDDTAVLKWHGEKETLITTDMLIEDRHFRLKEATAFEIGWKAMAVNLSDIAAMAGTPSFAVVSAGLPGSLPAAFADELYQGLLAAAERFGVRIVGGDTNASDKLVLAVTLLGECGTGRAVLRSGARAGDVIFVSGTLGGSYASKKHLRFMPRLEEATFLSRHFKIHSMMDLSDGLASDIRRIAEESGVGAWICRDSLPLSDPKLSPENALMDGEDFELLFTLSPKEAARLTLCEFNQKTKFFTPVGRIFDKKEGVRLVQEGVAYPMPKGGYDHFGGRGK